MAKEIILDTNVPQGEALKAVNLSVNIELNSKAIYINGNMAVPYQGTKVLAALNADNNVRITELADANAQQPTGDARTKAEAKLVLANDFYDAFETALTAYLQGIYELNNPAV